MAEWRTVKQSCVESIESLQFPSTILVSSEAISRENNTIKTRFAKEMTRMIKG